jgi:hypothetical protein
MATHPAAIRHTPLTGALTFRRHQRATGLARLTEPYPAVDIKMGRRVVGLMNPPNPATGQKKWTISIMVREEPSRENPQPFRWKQLAGRWLTEAEARGWMEQHFTSLRANYDVYALDPD